MSESRETELIKAIIDNLDDSETEYTKTPQSRNEEILVSILNETEYTKTPQSREEELLLELKEKIGGLVPPVPPVIKRVTGNPIEFSDGADAPLVKCVSAITGSQDLHGQDKPWVGGAGKNKIEMVVDTIKAINSSGTWSGNSYTINGVTFTILTDSANNVIGIKVNGTATAEIVFILDNYSVKPSGTYTYSGYAENDQNIRLRFRDSRGFFALNNNTLTATRETEEYGISKTIVVPSGAVANNLVFTPMICLSNASNPTTFAPYSNICPITAYTEGEIEVRGKNLLDESTIINDYYLNDMGVPANIEHAAYYTQYIPVTSGTYTISFTKADDNLNFYVRIHGYNSSKVWQSLVYKSSSTIVAGGFYSFSFTVPSGISFVRFSFGDDISNVQIEKGSSATAYEPYKCTTHTATFSQSIYQGNADFVGSGSPSVKGNKIALKITDASTSTVKYYSELTGRVRVEYTPLRGVVKANTGYLCDCFEGITIDYGPYQVSNSSSASRCYFTFPTGTSAEDCILALQTLQPTIVYEPDTPTTSSITPTNLPLKSLFGYNHIESSTGEMVVDYITEGYQNFVDTVESALPSNTRNLLTASKGGTKAMDIFLSLEKRDDKKEEVKEETKDDMR